MSAPPPEHPNSQPNPYEQYGQVPAQHTQYQNAAFAPHGGQTAPQSPSPSTNGMRLAFIALLVLAGVAWLIGIGQAIVLGAHSHTVSDVFTFVSVFASWTSGALLITVFVLLLFPYRRGHLIGLILAVIYFVTRLVFSVLNIVSVGMATSVIPILESFLVLAAGVLGYLGWRQQHRTGTKSGLRVVGIILLALPLAFGGFIGQLTVFLSQDSMMFSASLITTVIPQLLISLATVAVLLLAPVDAAWSRLLAAIFAGILFLAELIRGIVSFSMEITALLAPFNIVHALGFAATGVILAISAVVTKRARDAQIFGQPPVYTG